MRRSNNPQPALGTAIRLLRQEQEVKQLSIAEDADITVAHLSKIENGKVNPTWGTVVAIARALGISMSALAEQYELQDRARSGPN